MAGSLSARPLRLAAAVVLGVLGAWGFASAAEPVPTVPRGGDPPARALFVGNSYFYYAGGLHRRVLGFARADGDDLAVTSETIGNGFLEQHDIAAYLARRPGYDLLLLQEHSSSSQTAANRHRFRRAVAAARKLATDHGTKLALYMTPAYASPHPAARPEQTGELEALYVDVANDNRAVVAPVGLAFAEAYRRRPEIGLQDRYDGSHPTLSGVYLAAAVVYATLFDRSPVGNSYDAEGEIDAATALFLQTVARDTVEAFFARTAGPS